MAGTVWDVWRAGRAQIVRLRSPWTKSGPWAVQRCLRKLPQWLRGTGSSDERTNAFALPSFDPPRRHSEHDEQGQSGAGVHLV
ncbi:MAG: hypothetical protein NTU83_03540 [Candidatus Hydrogenedentes bacterium]|nr:hypothetical protein [Candidatus Hydrogenedentota bacterium]